MQAKLSKTFQHEMDHIDVQNPDGVGQQVRIFVVSDQFKKMMVLQRHRMINDLLKEEISQVHAVNIEAKTLEQYNK